MKDDNVDSLPIEIGGEKKYLKLGPKAFRLAKGKHRERVSFAEMNDPDMDTLLRLAWMGLLPDDPTLTLDVFIDQVDEDGDMIQILTVTADAVRRLSQKPKTVGKPGNVSPGKG